MRLRRLADHRRKVVLVTLLSLSALLYVWSTSQSESLKSVRGTMLDIFTPALELSDWLKLQVQKPFAAILSYEELKRKNENLKIELSRLHAQYDELSEAHQMLRQLANCEFGDGQNEERYLPARIIGLNLGGAAKTAILDKGHEEGVLENAPVVAPEGLVGVVRQLGAHSSTMQFVCDPNCSIAIVIEETRDKGLLKGTGKPDKLKILFESPSKSLKEGLTAKTAGISASIYPAGLLVGKITSVEHDKHGNMIAEVKPVINPSQLDAVVILLHSRPLQVEEGKKTTLRSKSGREL